MCTGAELHIASSLVSGAGAIAGAAATSAAAQTENNFRQYQLNIQNKQLETDAKLAEVNASQVELQRREEARRLRASNEAFLAGSGVGTSFSFLEGSSVAADRALRNDVASLRLNLGVNTNRIADQIAVNRAEGQFSKARADQTSQSAYMNAAFDTASSAFGNAYKAKTYKV